MEGGRLWTTRIAGEDFQSLGHYEKTASRKIRCQLAHRKGCKDGTTRDDVLFDQLLQRHCDSMNRERWDKSKTVGKLFVCDQASSLDLV